MAGLYIHIPFCKGKCPYCDFYSIVSDRNTISEYQSAVIDETRLISIRMPESQKINTIFLGGGTPSIDQNIIIDIIKGAGRYLKLETIEEFTIEVNPEDVYQLNLEALREIGVNRISVGMQSFSDSHLKILGRRTDSDTNISAYNRLRESGFDAISIDLIYGIRNGGIVEWKKSVEKAIELMPDHISIYELSILKENPLYKEKASDDMVVDMYYLAIEKLSSSGYRQYEISNLSLLEKECRHNLTYWRYGEYIGLGPSASSFINGVRYTNFADLSVYMNMLSKGELPVEYSEQLNNEKRAREALMLALRLIGGANIPEFEREFGYNLKNLIKDIPDNIKNELISENYDRISLTQKGLILSDELFSYLI